MQQQNPKWLLWQSSLDSRDTTMFVLSIVVLVGLVLWGAWAVERPGRRRAALLAWWALNLALLGVGLWTR